MQTYRHYLLDARFGVLLEGDAKLLEEILLALRNPRWGVWLGRKCCLPANPIVVSEKITERPAALRALLLKCDYTGNEPLEQFDRIVEVPATEPGADNVDDAPVGFGRPIGERHAPRWIQRLARTPISDSTP